MREDARLGRWPIMSDVVFFGHGRIEVSTDRA